MAGNSNYLKIWHSVGTQKSDFLYRSVTKFIIFTNAILFLTWIENCWFVLLLFFCTLWHFGWQILLLDIYYIIFVTLYLFLNAYFYFWHQILHKNISSVGSVLPSWVKCTLKKQLTVKVHCNFISSIW